MTVRRGDIYYADLSPVIGSEQGGVRPVLVIQNDVGNKHSPTVICAAITSRMNKAKLPTHIEISAKKYRLVKNSVVLLEQIRTLDKKRLKEYICHVDGTFMEEVNEAIRNQPGTSYITEMGGKCQRYNFTERKKSDKMEQRVYEIKGELSNVRTFKICKH